MAKRFNRTGLAFLACLMLAPSTAFAFRSGPLPGLTGSIASGGASCRQCHGVAVGSGMVQIVGVPADYDANAFYDLIIRISDPVQAGAGFQLSVEDAAGTHVGTLIVSDATNTQLNPDDSNYINHTSTGVSNAVANWGGLGNAAEYPVRWQAPPGDVGPITFWAAGNAINNNFASSGDFIYLTNQTIETALPPVPATSEWGALAMALVVLTCGSLLLRQHRRHSADS